MPISTENVNVKMLILGHATSAHVCPTVSRTRERFCLLLINHRRPTDPDYFQDDFQLPLVPDDPATTT
jgi:hypothetical protein